MKNFIKDLALPTAVAGILGVIVGGSFAGAGSAVPAVDTTATTVPTLPAEPAGPCEGRGVSSEANPFICIDLDATYEGERWLSIHWGCSATSQEGATTFLHRDFADDTVNSMISSEIAGRWQRAIGEIWHNGYPTAIVAGPDYFEVHFADGLNIAEMEAAAVWVNGVLWFHDVCGHRPHKSGPDTTDV